MHTIQVSVRDKIATQTDGTVIINGNSDYNIEFDFDAEWADLNNKVGIFAYNDAAAHKWAYQTVMFSGNTCTVPILRDIHCVYVGVTAGNVRVTTPAKVQCRLSISDYADTEDPPSADIWGQILAKLDELQTEIDEIKAGGGITPDWAQNDPNGKGYIKNKPFYETSKITPADNQFVDIVNMTVGEVVKLNDYLNMITVWKNVDNVLGNMASPWFIFRFFSTRFNKEIDFSYGLYTNRQDITMLDEINFYAEFVASFGTDGQKKARIYFILDTSKLDTTNAELFNSKGVYYKCVESMASLQSCKIGIQYTSVARLDSMYLKPDVESANYKVEKLEDANNPEMNYPSVRAVKTALNAKLTRLNTVISYDDDKAEYVSSVDFATLLAAAQQPDKYVVTATKDEQSDLAASGKKEDLYLLTGVDIAGGMNTLTFACSAAKKSEIGSIEKIEEKRICITDGNSVFVLSESVISAMSETATGAIYRSSMGSGANTLGENSVNFATQAGATGVSAFATGYGLYNPRYGWAFMPNTASGNSSAAFGSNTKATQEAQFVCGKQNEEDTDGRYQFIVGVGGKNGFAVTTNGEIVMPDPKATNATYMKARFNSDGTITLIPLADETKSYTTECTANRVTAITAESTDTQYPTAKAVYDAIQAAIAGLANS